MTGATGVHLLLWSDDRQDWLLPAPGGDTVPVSGTGHERAVPMSVLRYAQRTGEPLVVDDATRDDRFARDPYFTDAGLLLAAGRTRPQPRQPAGGAAAGEPAHPRRVHHRPARRRPAHRRPARRLPRQRPALRRAHRVARADRGRRRPARRRIERDLHDGAQQRLVSLALRLRAAQAAAPPEADELAAQLDSLVTEATSALDELRELARGIHPVVLAEGGLAAALEVLARRSAVPVELMCGSRGDCRNRSRSPPTTWCPRR